jgi:hypothetical protein
MSVIPLSAANAPQSVTEPDAAPERPPGEFDHAAADKVISDAMAKYELQFKDEPNHNKGIDAHLTEATAKYDAKVADEKAFEASKESRAELNARYGAQGDLSQTLDRFIGAAEAFQRDPQGAGIQFAEAYLRASPYSLPDTPKAAPVEVEIDGHGRRETGKRLNDIIQSAIDNAEGDKKEFVATVPQREALKRIFPDLTFDQAVAKIVQIDTDARKDPVVVAAQIAAAYGLPVTQRQQQAQAQVNQAHNVIDRVAPQLPGLRDQEVRNRVAAIIQHRDFVSTGNAAGDLQRAYQVVAVQDRHNAAVEAHAQAELAKMPPELAKTVVHTIHSDPHFKIIAGRNVAARPFGDPNVQYLNFEVARGIAEEKLRSAGKARRAAPVRSSRGHPGSSGDSGGAGMDAVISAAMAKHGL